MTCEEAHKLEKECLEYLEKNFAFVSPEKLEARRITVEALEKQIPKIVKRVGVFEVAKCNCGSYVDLSDNFCRKCGQALKWGE